MNKKLLVLSIAGVLSLACVTGCAGKKQGWDKNKFNISISAREDYTEKEMLKLWKADYESKHPDVNIIVESWGQNRTSEQYITQYALNRNELTNIIYTTDDSTALLAQKRNFVDLRKYYEASEDTDYSLYYESMLHTTSYNGEFRPTTSYTNPTGTVDLEPDDGLEYGIYFAPREYNMPGLVFNKDAFAKIGVELPDKATWNFDAFISLVQECSAKIKDLYEVQGKKEFALYRVCELNQTWEPIYTSILKELGSDGLFGLDENEDPICNVGSDANVEVFKKIVSSFGEGNYIYGIDQELGVKDFPSNNVLMTPVSYPEVGNFISAVPNIEFYQFPCEYVGAGCGGYGILVDHAKENQTVNGVTKNTADLCWDFLKYTISEEGQNLCGREGFIQPVLKSLAFDGEWTKSFGEELDHTAFASAKELRLTVYNFAQPDKRTDLRTAVNKLFTSLFDTNASVSNIPSYISTATQSINKILQK